ncbi:MAG: GNAT family N-acetyltransferase [Anaerolineae bacterium]|nr:GNAT family N-acetyltransferase [Anaerolineae bacterium]
MSDLSKSLEQQGKDAGTYRIRRMEPHDIHTVMMLDRLVFSDPWPESAYTQEIYFNPLAAYFVLEFTHAMPHWRWPWKPRNATLIGFAGMRVEQARGHISTLAIHQDWRGMGFGELLLITALEQTMAMKASAVMLEVRPTNTPARKLYSKYAFISIGRHTRYYQDGEDALLLEVPRLDAAYAQKLAECRQRVEQRIEQLVEKRIQERLSAQDLLSRQ